MAQAAWEKTGNAEVLLRRSSTGGRWKFLVGGLLILGSIAYLIISGTLTSARFFITVDEVVNNPAYVGQTVQITGAVLGDTIDYDADSGTIRFTIVSMPEEFDDLATALHEAVNNPNSTRLDIVVENSALPDLLQHEAQAILPGKMNADGSFYASDLLLKCPSRFEEAAPEQDLPVDHPEI